MTKKKKEKGLFSSVVMTNLCCNFLTKADPSPPAGGAGYCSCRHQYCQAMVEKSWSSCATMGDFVDDGEVIIVACRLPLWLCGGNFAFALVDSIKVIVRLEQWLQSILTEFHANFLLKLARQILSKAKPVNGRWRDKQRSMASPGRTLKQIACRRIRPLTLFLS